MQGSGAEHGGGANSCENSYEIFPFQKMRRVTWIYEELLASWERYCSMKLETVNAR